MADGGVYIPANTWKIIQTLMIAAMVGVWGMIWSMHGKVGEIEDLREDIAALEVELATAKASDISIQTSLTKIETELPYIKTGISDVKALLKDR